MNIHMMRLVWPTVAAAGEVLGQRWTSDLSLRANICKFKRIRAYDQLTTVGPLLSRVLEKTGLAPHYCPTAIVKARG